MASSSSSQGFGKGLAKGFGKGNDKKPNNDPKKEFFSRFSMMFENSFKEEEVEEKPKDLLSCAADLAESSKMVANVLAQRSDAQEILAVILDKLKNLETKINHIEDLVTPKNQ